MPRADLLLEGGGLVAADRRSVLIGASGTLAHRPDVGRARLEPVVDPDVSPRVELDAGDFESDAGRVGSAPGRDQDVAGGDGLLSACPSAPAGGRRPRSD